MLLAVPENLAEGRLYPPLLTARQAAEMVQRTPSTIRSWAHRGHVAAARHDPRTGAAMYPRRALWDAELATRRARGGRSRRRSLPG